KYIKSLLNEFDNIYYDGKIVLCAFNAIIDDIINDIYSEKGPLKKNYAQEFTAYCPGQDFIDCTKRRKHPRGIVLEKVLVDTKATPENVKFDDSRLIYNIGGADIQDNILKCRQCNSSSEKRKTGDVVIYRELYKPNQAKVLDKILRDVKDEKGNFKKLRRIILNSKSSSLNIFNLEQILMFGHDYISEQFDPRTAQLFENAMNYYIKVPVAIVKTRLKYDFRKFVLMISKKKFTNFDDTYAARIIIQDNEEFYKRKMKNMKKFQELSIKNKNMRYIKSKLNNYPEIEIEEREDNIQNPKKNGYMDYQMTVQMLRGSFKKEKVKKALIGEGLLDEQILGQSVKNGKTNVKYDEWLDAITNRTLAIQIRTFRMDYLAETDSKMRHDNYKIDQLKEMERVLNKNDELCMTYHVLSHLIKPEYMMKRMKKAKRRAYS
ncbi:MAG: hypothetical protein U9R34_07315, partial [Nanoarchaeota archaeon]|nr:hypothetical protein [Nanoarchaeota archaeon]